MGCVLGGRDSVVVLPTGGGKSLCFQAPAMCSDGLAVVVSPLISLMKDQVDALRSCGVPAAYVNSSLSPDERREVADEIRAGRLKLVYMAPERLVTDSTIEFLKQSNVSFVAVDEAHCISAWGHDFRPEYRELRRLKQAFPDAGIHAYTATATEQVRADISAQLGLNDPKLLVGSFDRPNLVYRVERTHNRLAQIRDVVERHAGESGIIYCITRAKVDDTAAALTEMGYRVLPYHAGMSDIDRKRNQEAFIEEKVDTIVATVAFGMGIDKSNVRYVIHAGMPKSIENYQQESGRAGRDGLEAECCLFYSSGDYGLWKRLTSDPDSQARQSALNSLSAMFNYCTDMECRHRVLVNYFGQELPGDSCKACDVCLDGFDPVDEPLIVGQKILSCLVRLKQRFGGDYTAKVLKGSQEQRIMQSGHNQLSTWGILSDESLTSIRSWIEQLTAQKFVCKAGEYNVLEVTEDGWRLLRGELTPNLLVPKEAATAEGQAESAIAADSWEGVDRELFEVLRQLRRQKADDKQVPPYVVFSDAALRDMARRRPSTLDGFLEVRGVGQQKCADYGDDFITCIAEHCREQGLETDVRPVQQTSAKTRTASQSGPNESEFRAFGLFRKGLSMDEVAETMARAPSTVRGYLTAFLRHEQITDPLPWVDATTVERITQAADEVGVERLKPVFDRLDGAVSYDEIHIVVGCLRNRTETSERGAGNSELGTEE